MVTEVPKVSWILGEKTEKKEEYTVTLEERSGTTVLAIEEVWCNPLYPPDPDGVHRFCTEDIEAVRDALAADQPYVVVHVLEGKRSFSGGVGSYSETPFLAREQWRINFPQQEEEKVALQALLTHALGSQ